MLRVYAIPPVEAATPDVDPQPSSNTATAEDAAALGASTLSVSASVAPPEVFDQIESSSAAPPEASLLSISPPAEPVSLPDEPKPVETLVNEAVAAPEPVASSKPEFTSPQQPPKSEIDSSPALSSEAEKAEAEAVEPDPIEPNPQGAPLSTTGKPDTNSARTIAGMRQIVEKRLETIVSQDKEIRGAKWQQNLVQVVLEYAWQGKFETARQVAANPGLPLDLQMSLLGKIAAIETEFLASQVVQSPDAAGKPQTKQTVGQAAIPQGRNLPTGYSTVGDHLGNLSALSGYAGVLPGSQCPILESSPSQAIAPPQALPRPLPVPKGKVAGVPAFVPALGHNLASRLARLSQTQPAANAAKAADQSSVSPASALVAPQLFVGVAARSVQTQPNPSVSQSVQQATAPKTAIPKAIETQPLSAKPVQIKASSQKSESPFAERLFPSQNRTQFQAPIPEELATVPANPVARQAEIETANSAQQATLPASDAFQPFGFAFPELFENPLDWVWNWWNLPLPQAQSQPIAAQSPSLTEPDLLPIAAEVGLTNSSLFQTIEQDLSATLQPLRSAYKLSISLPASKKGSLKAPLKPSVSDPNTLLAISCRQAQLGQSNWTNALINPATAKHLGWVNFMFPLPIPAVITSAFGWRTHPISGDLRFHTGLDIGAPMGTPVLSASNGQVVAANAMGGYGLAVVVENETTNQRNLYAHLSGIAVQPGAIVKAGTVLGWVGSTGNSTGPHLHFEAQVKTENGWTVIDPLASAAVAVAQTDQATGTP